VIAGTNRGYLHINRINLLGFFPVIANIEQLANAFGMINQLVTVYSVRV
jgi:hypothetical protein